jgi:hypothetical protein
MVGKDVAAPCCADGCVKPHPINSRIENERRALPAKIAPCPILATFLFLSLGWETSTLNLTTFLSNHRTQANGVDRSAVAFRTLPVPGPFDSVTSKMLRRSPDRHAGVHTLTSPERNTEYTVRELQAIP